MSLENQFTDGSLLRTESDSIISLKLKSVETSCKCKKKILYVQPMKLE